MNAAHGVVANARTTAPVRAQERQGAFPAAQRSQGVRATYPAAGAADRTEAQHAVAGALTAAGIGWRPERLRATVSSRKYALTY